MEVEDMRFAAEVIYKNGRVAFICSPGDLFNYYDSEDKSRIAAVYVKDFSTKRWVEADKAYYLYGGDVKGPMDYGIIAFKDMASAKAFMKQHKAKGMLTFQEVLNKKIYK